MERIAGIFIFSLVALKVTGQNLVPNGDFEGSVNCSPYSIPQMWYPPTWGTPDYFGINDTGGCSLPQSGWGGGTFPCGYSDSY